jgi:hypothetical protein
MLVVGNQNLFGKTNKDFVKIIRQDWVEPNINYIGIAPIGTAENKNIWNIFQIIIEEDGTENTLSTTGSWTNRYLIF